MARLNEDGQWIILMALIICIGIFFLAVLVNQSVLVGQTTAEAVLEFPKSDIQDLRNEVWVIYSRFKGNPPELGNITTDIEVISLARKTAVVNISTNSNGDWIVHYNNGITMYHEEIYYDQGYHYFHY